MKQKDAIIIHSVQRWFEKAVLGLNLCPFAHKPQRQGGIRFELSFAASDEECLSDIYLNLMKLDQHPEIETLVLICASYLENFEHYNQFLNLADHLLQTEGWEGIYQIASFHPDYCFAGSHEDDRVNWTNRSPYPLFHLIREQSIEAAVASHPDVSQIPTDNIQTLNGLSDEKMWEIFRACDYSPQRTRRNTEKS